MRRLPQTRAFKALLIAAIGTGLLLSKEADADRYFNSSEIGCSPADPNPDYLWCDDFEDGVGWVTDADHGGENDPNNDGWAGTIYCTDTQGDGDWVLCNSYGAAGSSCALQKGNESASCHAGWHRLSESVNEIYFRAYWWIAPGSNQGQEKLVGLGGKSCFTCTNSDYGWLEQRHRDGLMFLNTNDPTYSTAWLGHNVSPLPYVQGHWYYVEFRFKQETTPTSNDGVFEMWADDCGADGRQCTGPGTLRARHTGLDLIPGDFGSNSNISWVSLWGWSGPDNSGLRKWDQIIVSKRRVGPVGSTSPPGSPPAAPVLLE